MRQARSKSSGALSATTAASTDMTRHLVALLEGNAEPRALLPPMAMTSQRRFEESGTAVAAAATAGASDDDGAEALLNQAFLCMATHVSKIGAIHERDLNVATRQAVPFDCRRDHHHHHQQKHASNGHNSVITVDPTVENALAMDETISYVAVPNVVAAVEEALHELPSASGVDRASVIASFLQNMRFALLDSVTQQYPSVQEFSNAVTRLVHSVASSGGGGGGGSVHNGVGYTLERYCELLAVACIEANAANRFDLDIRPSNDVARNTDITTTTTTTKWTACVCAITPSMETGRRQPTRVYALCFFEPTSGAANALMRIRGCVFVCDTLTTAAL